MTRGLPLVVIGALLLVSSLPLRAAPPDPSASTQDLAAGKGPQPAFGTLIASPPNFVSSTPTPVVFTIQIEAPTLNPTTVELQRVDADGRFQAPLGRMYDNGKSGDRRAGDRVFTASVTLNESEVGRAHFRVEAAFRGNSQNGQSTVAFVDVDPFPLPPDPGEAGKQTIDGVDSDDDDVRDDIQRHIGLTYPESSTTRAALTQYAVALQGSIRAGVEAQSTSVDPENEVFGVRCVAYLLGAETVTRAISAVQVVALNTSERFEAYLVASQSAQVVPDSQLASDLKSFCAAGVLPSGGISREFR